MYEKQNFKPGQKLKAEELNKMEQGIVDLESAIGSGGIYIGKEPPAGENVNVWIDTDEEVEEPKDGEDGATFTPSVSADGVISWTNNRGLNNPEPVNIRGKDGKSAYEYAKDGGYTGTEAEFAKLMAGGTGGGGQADWNANEGEAGHVLNRTHYREIVDLLPETTVPLDEAEGVYMFDSNMTFTEGETYFVKWNGVEYTCVAWSVSEDDGEGGTVTIGFIGNKMFMEGEDTGEPFVFANLGALVAYPFDTLPEITASISAYQYRKIPAEYLPSYVVTVLQEHITTGSDNMARMSFDTTELVYALENNIPVWLDISDMKKYVANARLLVIHWDTLYAPLSTQPKDKTFVCLYAYKVGLNQNLCETFTVFVNQDD